MPDAVRIYKFKSKEMKALLARLEKRAQQADVALGGSNSELLARARSSGDKLLAKFAEVFFEGLHPTIGATVERIIETVGRQGDLALVMLTRLFDSTRISREHLRVSKGELNVALTAADEKLLELCRDKVLPRLHAFHERQKCQSWQIDELGGSCGVRNQALKRVALYVPGGKAFYPSSLMMSAVPALVAGVKEIAVFTPPGSFEKTPLFAALLRELGITEVYRVGGAQAVAAAALGTQTIKRVDKVVGPGNQFVATAKRMLYGTVDIDSFAGASEVVVVFDKKANPKQVAADLLAQAEHDQMASALAITDSAAAAKAVAKEVERQLKTLPRAGIAGKSIASFGGVVVAKNIDDALEFADSLAPEHLELLTVDAERQSAKIHNAGAIFIGPYAPEAFGDYCAGPNHVLPTCGTARFASALSVNDFVRSVSVIRGSAELLKVHRETIVALARAEGLEAHARSVEARF